MSHLSYRSSRPNDWVLPRPHSDASSRYAKHGPILPMDKPTFLQRIFGKVK